MRAALSFSLIIVILLISVAPVLAQANTLILSVTVPEWAGLNAAVFDEFEAAHPGVQVMIKTDTLDAYPSPPAFNATEYLDTLGRYASSADVLYVISNTLTPVATRAGYFLDLAPVANADLNLDVNDFMPGSWQSFQWDGGHWAIPVSGDWLLLTYDPAAFDAAGLAYPTENWTVDDFANATRLLTQRDANGAITMPGLLKFYDEWILRGLIGRSWYDSAAIPNVPQFTSPTAEAILTTWAQLESEGVIGYPVGMFGGDHPAPLVMGNAASLAYYSENFQPRSRGVLLPGNVAGLDLTGYAVSSGSAYPELAYELAKFMTSSPLIANSFQGQLPVRSSVASAGLPEDNPYGMRQYVPEIQPVIDAARNAALPIAEIRYGDYLDSTIQTINTGMDAFGALQQAEQQALTDLQSAEARRSTPIFVQNSALPTLAPGEIALRFGMTTWISPLPNQTQWDQLAADFAAHDPEVGYVEMTADFSGNFTDLSAQYDCFFTFSNEIPTADLSTLINLDPFMDTDPNFNRADIVGNTLAQLQRDHLTWGFPLMIMPQVMYYNRDIFSGMGIAAPQAGWSTQQFIDTLYQLRPNPTDPAPFDPGYDGSNTLLSLIAAFGGVPLDDRTTPPTPNFTDPATMDAIRQVLDLAKAGYIGYQRLAVQQSGMGGQPTAIYSAMINPFGMMNGANTPAAFPVGSQFSGISYTIGTGYISATSANPGACYRWLNAISRDQNLFSAMPVYRSLISTTPQGIEAVAMYTHFDTLLQDPNTIIFSNFFTGAGAVGTMILQHWLNRAFDRYVLDNADLAAELTTAQQLAVDWASCTAGLPSDDPGFINCATMLDPELLAFLTPQ